VCDDNDVVIVVAKEEEGRSRSEYESERGTSGEASRAECVEVRGVEEVDCEVDCVCTCSCARLRNAGGT